jgi:hypothetical protein
VGQTRSVRLRYTLPALADLRGSPKMDSALATGYRRPRESGGPGATAAALPTLDSRFRGNDEEEW